jgi:uncharacterized membrane protein
VNRTSELAIRSQATKADFKVPALLLALSVVPTLGGVVRLMSISGEVAVTPDNARFLRAPAPVVMHVVSATLYCLLGAFQFSRGLRLGWPGLHRRAGRLLVLSGLSTGVTGLWMTVFYRIPPSLQGPVLYAVRVAVAAAMVASILIAYSSILRRNVARHEAFMIRAYALGQGAGTQVVVLLPWTLISGETGGLTRDLLMTLAWTINVVVAESIIRLRAPALNRSPSCAGRCTRSARRRSDGGTGV